ncbi:armadillo-type protein [Coprinopsis sp. MPI-PUGE-AT-0042]|nr:armadillo-type protein [Coprinopsis sp. MPI-PUGE-AT-0042]
MADSNGKVPPDIDLAEKGSYTDFASADPGEKGYKTDFDENAKAWAMYLQEAEKKANEQGELWKTGVESLLIFAGLFAGVITSFLAESRKKLRLEDQEALLMDIRSALRNEPPSTSHTNRRPPSFGAIMGVLARSWVVNHLPISNRKDADAEEAHKRWILDERAKEWKLEKVITGIPLLVQLAFFLFSLGLGIQTYHDNKILGIFVLSMIAGGTVLYLVVTALPLVLPPDSCPFQTPLSDILRDLQALLRPKSRRQSGSAPKVSSDILATILLKGLIKSRKPEHADEAASVLSHLSPRSPHLKNFVNSQDTPNACMRRIRECTFTRFDKSSQRDEIIGAHLQALSRLIASWEAKGHNKEIGARFQELIGRSGILGRWDFLPESLRALAYAVRVPLYLASGLDFEDNVSPGKEWETVIHYVQPTYRLGFVISACRGTMQRKPNMQKVSSFSAVHLVTRGYLSIKQGRRTDWNHLPNYQGQVDNLCRDYLGNLFESIASTWKGVPKAFLSIPSGPEAPSRLSATEVANTYVPKLLVSTLEGYPPASLLYALTALELGVRSQGNAILVALAQRGNVESSTMETLLSGLFETMFDSSYQPSTVRPSIETAVPVDKLWFNRQPSIIAAYKDVVTKTLSEQIHKALERNDLLEDKDKDEDEDKEKGMRGAFKVIQCIADQVQMSGLSGTESRGIEETLWIVAPRLVEIDLTLKYPPSLDRWLWLKPLFHSESSSEAQLLRFRRQLQVPLRLKLMEVCELYSGDPKDRTTRSATENPTLEEDELLGPVIDLLFDTTIIAGRSISVLDCKGPDTSLSARLTIIIVKTLEQAFAPNIAKLVALALRAPAHKQSGLGPVSCAGVDILLALSENWNTYLSDYRGTETPTAQVREEVYQTLQTLLQDDLACEAPVGFLRLLLEQMNVIEEYEVSESGDNEVAAMITTAGSRRLGPTVTELLKCFIKNRWSDPQAVQLLLELMSKGKHFELTGALDGYFEAVVACLPKVENVWSETLSESGSAVSLVVSLVKSLVVRVYTSNPLSLGWRDGVDLLIDLGLNSTCIDTRNEAAWSLLSLLDKQDIWESVMNGIKTRIVMLALNQQTLEKTEQDAIQDNWKMLLLVISMHDIARDFCSFVLGHLANKNITDGDLNLPTNFPQVSLPDFSKQVEDLSLHPNVHIRQVALEFLAKSVPECEVVNQLIGLALDNSNERFSLSCLTRLVNMASSDKLLPLIIQGIKDIVDQKKLDSVWDVSWGKQWVILLKKVSQYGAQADLTSLVQIAETDELWEVRVAAMESLTELADGHAEAIVTRTSLARNAKVGGNDPIAHARKTWASTLGHLARMGHWRPVQDALIEMALCEYEDDVRHQAYHEIDMLLGAGGDHATSILASLTNTLERRLKGNDSFYFSLADFGTMGRSHGVRGQPNLSIELMSALLQTLIKQALVESEFSYCMEQALDSVAEHAKPDHYKVIVKCVAGNLASSSPWGAQEAMELVSRNSSNKLPSIVAQRPGHSDWDIDPLLMRMTPLFKDSSRHLRTAALDIFSSIVSSECGSADVMCPPLISMALEDYDYGLRNDAAELLCVISTEDYSEVATLVNVNSFLELLSAPKPLNTTVARLLGVLYQHDDARERIGLWIIDQVVETREIASNLQQGILTLLSELVNKKRLTPSVPLDYILLLLSASLALKGTPATEPHRPLILTSLALFYQDAIPDRESKCFGDLTRAFEYAAFGMHGTEEEARAWLAEEEHIKEPPQPPQSLSHLCRRATLLTITRRPKC